MPRAPRKITFWNVFVALEADVRDLISFHPKLPEATGSVFKKIMVAHLDAVVLGLKKALQKVTLAWLVRELRNGASP